VVANHNSHLDTLVLMSLFPIAHLHEVRPRSGSGLLYAQPRAAVAHERTFTWNFHLSRADATVRNLSEAFGGAHCRKHPYPLPGGLEGRTRTFIEI
jgi:hypothetical protein